MPNRAADTIVLDTIVLDTVGKLFAHGHGPRRVFSV
jgi:hypothetical protein